MDRCAVHVETGLTELVLQTLWRISRTAARPSALHEAALTCSKRHPLGPAAFPDFALATTGATSSSRSKALVERHSRAAVFTSAALIVALRLNSLSLRRLAVLTEGVQWPHESKTVAAFVICPACTKRIAWFFCCSPSSWSLRSCRVSSTCSYYALY